MGGEGGGGRWWHGNNELITNGYAQVRYLDNQVYYRALTHDGGEER